MRGVLIAVLLFICVSCTTTKYVDVPVPIETIKTEYVQNIQYDSIHVHDSIDRYIRGDTVFLYKYRDIYKYKLKTDTIVKTESVEIPVEVKTETIKEVNKIKGYQYFLMYSGIGFLLTLALAIYKLIRKIVK